MAVSLPSASLPRPDQTIPAVPRTGTMTGATDKETIHVSYPGTGDYPKDWVRTLFFEDPSYNQFRHAFFLRVKDGYRIVKVHEYRQFQLPEIPCVPPLFTSWITQKSPFELRVGFTDHRPSPGKVIHYPVEFAYDIERLNL